MKPALIFGMVGWLAFLGTLALPSSAQSPLYMACVTLTPSSTIPTTLTPRATSTTIPIIAPSSSPTPSPTLHEIFTTATALSDPRLPFNTPTIDEFTPTPIQAQARYRVDSLSGVNVRVSPGTSAGIVSSLPLGAVVVVTEMSQQYIDGWQWGRVTGGWVAMRSVNGVVLLRAVQ